ncbi:hypothetical protein [Polymorphospora rubra]|uniref:Uncharacterized protein n=1 Tax=Polymorphospora rubra TaxID=338584 RepID=A0A810MV80_9ACTN|nr:hypothetical protein [Polymorphospora rubra]BCJ65096.1 hypothetical protein Prubr_21170 [Polymorphospora rubra]
MSLVTNTDQILNQLTDITMKFASVPNLELPRTNVWLTFHVYPFGPDLTEDQRMTAVDALYGIVMPDYRPTSNSHSFYGTPTDGIDLGHITCRVWTQRETSEIRTLRIQLERLRDENDQLRAELGRS